MASGDIFKSWARTGCSAGSRSSTVSNSSTRSPWHLSNTPCMRHCSPPLHYHLRKGPHIPANISDKNGYCSILFQYRIFPIVQFRRILIWCNYFVVCLTITCILVSIFQCIPIHDFWDTLAGKLTSDLGGRCIDVELYFLTVGAVNAATDFVLLALVSERCDGDDAQDQETNQGTNGCSRYRFSGV